MLAPWAQQQIMQYLFTGETLGTRPTQWYVALHTGHPGLGDDNEVTSGGDPDYARQAVAFDVSLVGSRYETAGTQDVSFGPAGAGASYTATYVTVKDAATEGNTLVIAALPVPIPVTEGGLVTIPIGELVVEGGA